jgi:hypothetical protein
MGNPAKMNDILFHPRVSLEPLYKWGMEFIGPIVTPRVLNPILNIVF